MQGSSPASLVPGKLVMVDNVTIKTHTVIGNGQEIELVNPSVSNHLTFHFFRAANFLNFSMFTADAFLLSACWVSLG